MILIISLVFHFYRQAIKIAKQNSIITLTLVFVCCCGCFFGGVLNFIEFLCYFGGILYPYLTCKYSTMCIFYKGKCIFGISNFQIFLRPPTMVATEGGFASLSRVPQVFNKKKRYSKGKIQKKKRELFIFSVFILPFF